MFQSIIISGGDQEKREETVESFLKKQSRLSPDVLIVNQEGAIGINIVREIKTWLNKKAFREKTRFVLIYQAQNLTVEAQNALLKTLEEPPLDTSLVLISTNHYQLLPTIISRCQVIRLKNNFVPNPKAAVDQGLAKILTKDLGEKIIFARERGGERQGFADWLQDQRQQLMSQKKSHQTIKILAILNQTETMVQANVSPRSALSYLLSKEEPTR